MGLALPEVAHVLDHLNNLLGHVLVLCGQNGPAIALIAAFLESLIGVGTILPGGTAVVLAGFAARHHGLSGFLSIAAMAWLGMTAGSAVDYWLGRLCGRRLVPRGAPWRLAARWRKVLRSSRRFMRRWGWWAILVANLAGPGRSAVAVASGASGWSFGAFLLGQSLAAALWSAAFVGIGYFAAGEATRLQMVVSGAGIATAVVFAALIGAQLALRTLLERAVRRLRPRTAPV
jgi:membrane protein DedA with SNARE-associated domain